MRALEELGRAVENRWRARGFDLGVFPEIAARALTEAGLHERCDAQALLAQAASSPLPKQRDPASSFGQPPITVYDSEHFHVDLIVWMNTATSVHQHSFSGAFGLLTGEDLHCTYSFDEHERWDPCFTVGAVEHRYSEILRAGDWRPIVAGPDFIHVVHHLDRPSVSVVIRTGREPLRSPQFTYLAPHLGHDPFYKQGVPARQLQILDVLRETDGDAYPKTAAEFLQGADRWGAFELLTRAARDATARRFLPDLLDAARTRFPELVEILPPVLVEVRREAEVNGRLHRVRDPDHRFLLGLLQSVRDRGLMFELVRERDPEADPAARIATWLDALGGSHTDLFEPGPTELCRAVLREGVAPPAADSDSDDPTASVGSSFLAPLLAPARLATVAAQPTPGPRPAKIWGGEPQRSAGRRVWGPGKLAAALEGPELYPLGIDLDAQEFYFTRVSRAGYENSTFHEARIESLGDEAFVVGFDEFPRFRAPEAEPEPIHYLMHHGFACSTLTSRCLEHVTGRLALREPGVLTQLTHASRSADPAIWDRALDIVLALYARPYPGRPGIFIKGHDSGLAITAAVLARDPRSKALYVHVPARTAALNFVRDPRRDSWVKAHLQQSFVTDPHLPDLPPADSLSPPQRAVLLWLGRMAHFRALEHEFGEKRFAAFDGDAFTQAPTETLKDALGFLEVGWDEDRLAGLEESDLFQKHAKVRSRRFDPDVRARELKAADEQWGTAVDAALDWVSERIAAHAGDPEMRFVELAADWNGGSRLAS